MNDLPKVQAPNCSLIPNILFDKWMRLLSVDEFKVASAIMRLSQGATIPFDYVSDEVIPSIARMTAINDQKVLKIIATLFDAGFFTEMGLD